MPRVDFDAHLFFDAIITSVLPLTNGKHHDAGLCSSCVCIGRISVLSVMWCLSETSSAFTMGILVGAKEEYISLAMFSLIHGSSKIWSKG